MWQRIIVALLLTLGVTLTVGNVRPHAQMMQAIVGAVHHAAGAVYSGACDVVSGLTDYWGVDGCGSAYATATVANVCTADNGGGLCADVSLIGGFLTPAAFTGTLAACSNVTPCYFNKFYGQISGTATLTRAGAFQLQTLFNCAGTTHVCAYGPTSAYGHYTNVGVTYSGAMFSMLALFEPLTNGDGSPTLAMSSTGSNFFLGQDSTSHAYFFNGSNIASSATILNVITSMTGVQLNTASSFMTYNGVAPVVQSAGSAGLAGDSPNIFQLDNGTNTAYFMHTAIAVSTTYTSSNAFAACKNDVTNWGVTDLGSCH